ncbi:murein hydrolase activator EnvC family protein [Candidatus Bodocaedibacter vickermanii]|uniref:Murein hydrolase activator NlpD n=1 Tax=Candidatus Bodocaedibacter vickermanii TaxID=2741701 RepID=A0A7L9RSI3_9PROT|nr:Murein hydrolase activator NlpD [Candidatus Paracaedibacteraceae bacterium 'Lake Konstanz']
MNTPIAYANLMLLTLLVLLGSGCSRGSDESPVSFEERSTRHTENMTPEEWESFKNKAIESIIRKYTGETKSGSGRIHVSEIPSSSSIIESAPVTHSEPAMKPRETSSHSKLDVPETLAPSALPAIKSPPVKSEQKTQEKVERYSQLKIKPEETKGKQYKVPPNAVAQAESAAITAPQPTQPVYAWPVKGSVSKGYGSSDKGTNNGINIKAKAGSPVVAIDNGKVIFVGAIKGMGKVVLIEHSNQMIAAYAQVGGISVRANDTVKKSQRIADILATEGSDGELHFELRKGTKSLNPMEYLPK